MTIKQFIVSVFINVCLLHVLQQINAPANFWWLAGYCLGILTTIVVRRIND